MPPLSSESFTAIATRGVATFDADGNARGTATTSTGTIRYNAATDSYTLTTPGGTITFGPSDIDQASSSAGATAYLRTNGGTTDSLTLTRPGTSGRLTYKYVGGAFWQHSVIGQTGGNGFIDALVYGVPAPVSAVPKTGIGNYAVDLIGALAVGLPAPIAGSGTASVDFASGTILIGGGMSILQDMTVNPYFSFEGVAKMGSNAAFAGNLTFRVSPDAAFSGPLNGRLFGPGAEEIGAAFAGQDGAGHAAIGTLLGRTTDQAGAQLSSTTEALLNFTGPAAGQSALTNPSTATDHILIQYRPDAQTFVLGAPDRTTAFNIRGQATSTNPASTEKFSPSYDNEYARAGFWLTVNGDAAASYRLSHFIYGLPTDAAAIVRTGRAGYALRFEGHAADGGAASYTDISGTGSLIADFAAGQVAIDGRLDFGASKAGTISGAGTMSSTANQLSGSLSFDGIGNYAGDFSGQFYGPAAQEVGGVFTASNGQNRAAGTFSGKQDASVRPQDETLQSISSPATLASFVYSARSASYDQNPGPEPTTIAYDPATGKYILTLRSPIPPWKYAQFGISRQDILAEKSDASRTWYEQGGEMNISGYLSNPGPNNPVIALSYTGFGEISMTYTDTSLYTGGTTNEHYYLIYGIETQPGAMPLSGSAGYSGIAVGTAFGSYEGPLSGTSRLMADFTAGTMNLSLHLVADNAARTPMGDYTMDGLISKNSFLANFSSSNTIPIGNDVSAKFNGKFFGPKAEEFGAVWHLSRGVFGRPETDMNMTGVAVGKRD